MWMGGDACVAVVADHAHHQRATQASLLHTSATPTPADYPGLFSSSRPYISATIAPACLDRLPADGYGKQAHFFSPALYVAKTCFSRPCFELFCRAAFHYPEDAFAVW